MSFEKNLDTIHSNYSMSFWDAVALGRVAGWDSIEKFGENPEITTNTDPEDIWSQGGLYVFSTTADIETLSSSDVTDTQEITIEGLDIDCEVVVQTATLNGQNAVTLTTPLYRCYRAYNSNSTDLAGDVYVSVSGALTGGVPIASNVRSKIPVGSGQTEMCVYTVPAGKTGYFLGGYVSLSRPQTSRAVFTSRVRTEGGVFRVLSRIATPDSWQYRYPIPQAIPEKADIILRCDSVSATVGVSGGFTIALEDN